MSVYDSEDHKIILPKFVSLIKNTEVPVTHFCKDIVEWLSSPKHKKFESYSALYRDALDSNKNGVSSKPETWGDRLTRIEEIHNACIESKNPWAQIISSETIAHRWFDMEYHLQLTLYRDKWIKGYDDSHQISLKMLPKDSRFAKFVDSSLYWKANSFYRMKEFSTAKDIFCQIHNRKGKRYVISNCFTSKIKFAKKVCLNQIDLEEKMYLHLNKKRII